MSWAELRPLIRESLAAVPGIGQVHDYVRHTRFWDDFFRKTVKDGRVNVWEFTRISMASAFDDVGDRQVVGAIFRNTHQVSIIGRMALDEEAKTEHLSQDLADAVLAAFRAQVLFGGKVHIPVPATLDSFTHASYGGVLVHEARITAPATIRVAGSF